VLLQGVPDDELNLIDLKRLGDVVIRTTLHGLDSRFRRGKRRDQEHDGFGRRLLHRLQNLESTDPGHFQVRDDEVEDLFVDLCDGIITIGGLGHAIARTLEHNAQHLTHASLIVND
jgi:hypothetical protein